MKRFIYYGVIRDKIPFSRVETELTIAGMRVINYYPRLGIVKFDSDLQVTTTNFDFFDSVEEEKNDFFAQDEI